MSNVCVYSFADATGLTKYVDSQGDFLFTGTWSSGGTYTATPLMAAQYGAAYYMAIRDNVGDNPQRVPTRTRPSSWSIMSLLYEYQCGSGTVTPAEALAEAAWELAQSGTNIAWAAYYLAQIGTNTGSAAYDLATAAYALAQQGTITTVGSVPYAGTIYFDFAGSDYQQTTVNGALAVNAVNYTAGAEISVLLLSTGTTWPLYMAGSVSATTWFGTTPPPQIYDKDVILALTCLSSSPVALIGAPSVEA